MIKPVASYQKRASQLELTSIDSLQKGSFVTLTLFRPTSRICLRLEEKNLFRFALYYGEEIFTMLNTLSTKAATLTHKRTWVSACPKFSLNILKVCCFETLSIFFIPNHPSSLMVNSLYLSDLLLSCFL